MAAQTISREYYKNRRSLSERFAEMDEKIKVPSFRQSTGKANEVNYWVFDYPPEQELEVRSHIEWLKKHNRKGFDDYELIIYDLYNIIIDRLTEKGFIEKTKKLESRGGIQRVGFPTSWKRRKCSIKYFTICRKNLPPRQSSCFIREPIRNKSWWFLMNSWKIAITGHSA